jgi:hypothetical protein
LLINNNKVETNRERPRKRWIEDIEDDVLILGIRGWRKLCMERAE